VSAKAMQGRRQSGKTTVDQALMRGLDTALPIVRPGPALPCCGHRSHRVGHKTPSGMPHRGSASDTAWPEGSASRFPLGVRSRSRPSAASAAARRAGRERRSRAGYNRARMPGDARCGRLGSSSPHLSRRDHLANRPQESRHFPGDRRDHHRQPLALGDQPPRAPAEPDLSLPGHVTDLLGHAFRAL